MKKNLLLIALGLVTFIPAQAQWTHRDTENTIDGVLDAINSSIESAERKKQMEILAKEKAQYEQTFKDVMESAKEYERAENWEDALEKYEEAAKMNCKYDYTDQQQISRKITGLYAKAGRTEEGPSVLNNDKTILSDYSKYRYVRENPIYVNKRGAVTKILRVACSDTETRIEMEYTSNELNGNVNIKGTAYIKGNKGGKLSLVSVENISLAPSNTIIPWPFQKLRFALIFPPLPDIATEFDFVEPSTSWKYQDIKCK